MKFKLIFIAIILAIGIVWAGRSSTSEAQTVTDVQLQAEITLLNVLVTMPYSTWSATGKYDSLRKDRLYKKMAWAQDGCSVSNPFGLAHRATFTSS